MDGVPTHDDLREVVAWLEGGRESRWTIADWQAWSSRGFGWCYTSTRGLLLALARVRELEAELVLLRTERDQLQRLLTPPPSTHPPVRRATPPPPPPEARALRQPARRPPTEVERDTRRRLEGAVRALVDRLPPEEVEDVWREVSQVELEAEVWADGETVYEDPHEGG